MGDDYQNFSLKMLTTGIAPGVVNDLVPKGKFQLLQNIRMITEGVLQSRPKIDQFITLSPPTVNVPHTIKTILNPITGGFNRIIGAGQSIYSGSINLLPVTDGGYSGDPLTIIDFRPEEATDAYAYIGNLNKFKKVSTTGAIYDVGINAPTKAATFALAKPIRKVIANIKTADIGTWTGAGSAGVPSIVNRINTTITQILYDAPAAPNWASIIPADFSQIQPGAIVTLNAVEDVYVEEIFPSAVLAGIATVARISYDSGTNGLCTIVLSVPNKEIVRNSVLFLNSTEYVKVREVTRNENDFPSIRVSTVGTIAVGNTVVGAASFRTYVNGTFAATQAILAEALKSVVSASGLSNVTKVINVDLTNADGKPLKDEDFLHFSLKVSDSTKLIEMQVQLDNNETGNAYDKNFYTYVITPNFFLGTSTQTSSTLSVAQQAEQTEDILDRRIDDIINRPEESYYDRHRQGADILVLVDPENPVYFPSGSETGINVSEGIVTEAPTGVEQWTEVFIKLKDLLRTGSDNHRTRKDIKSIRVSVNTTAAIDIYVDSIWVGGGSELQTKGNDLDYNYVWRVRDPLTKAFSNWSPPLREGIRIIRNKLVLSFPDANVNFDNSFRIDIARFGGSLNDYRLIGSIKNDGSTFTDEVSDLTAAASQPASRRLLGNQLATELIFDFYRPFVFADSPKLGTCTVLGTKFTRTGGDNLNTTYPRGTQILINGKLNRFYTNPSSTNVVELEKDMGDMIGVSFEIKTPLLTGQPVPVIFGPFGEGNSGLVIFGLRTTDGFLYWLDGNSPDTMSDINFLEITSPSEPLLAGVMYDGYGIVFSNKRSFTIYSNYQTGALSFLARENANSRGVFHPNAICSSGDFIYLITENGDSIIRVAGNGVPQSLTDGTLYNLFIHNGVLPIPITLVDGTILYPPDFNQPKELRLYDTNDTVVFRFVDRNGQHVAIIFDKRIGDWISYDTYFGGKMNVVHKEEMISSRRLLVGIEGGVGQFEGATSREDAILSKVLPFSLDFGNSRMLKQLNEIVIDVNKGTGGFSYRNYFDNGNSSDPLVIIPGGIGSVREQIVQSLNSGDGKLLKNITTHFEWTLNSGVKLYEELFYYLPQADLIIDRQSDITFKGPLHDKYFQGIRIVANTFGLDKILRFTDDNGVVQAEITINHAVKGGKSYSFPEPFVSHLITRLSGDDVPWMFFEEEYIYDIEPEEGMVWEGQETTLDIIGFKTLQRNGITLRSSAPVTVQYIYDGFVETYTDIIPSTANTRDKKYFYLRARKGKLIKIRIESNEPFRVYKKDCEVWARGFNSTGAYEIKMPFGDIHRETEVLI